MSIMEKKQAILESRKKLDNALSLPDLVNEDSIASLVKEQLARSSLMSNKAAGKFVESRTMEVSNFLEMLRSASGTSSSHLKLHKDWKVKQDTDQLRVMYCEGPQGSPFHTLLAEGFADGSMDVCLCVSWESTLYKKWWPQYSVPTFKIIASSCLQKVGIGEELAFIRMKVPWPISDREAVLHYFEIEYFKEDLVLVLIKTISDTEHIDEDAYGFNRDRIPLPKDTIRIDLVGGFVLQKVESNKCYFRAIFNFDIKLEFIPPSLINFISRQLIGNGHKLYQKAVGSVATTDEDYRSALQGPLYARIRQHLHTGNKTSLLKGFDHKKLLFPFNEHKVVTLAKDDAITLRTSVPEITEEDTEQSLDAEGETHTANSSFENLTVNKQRIPSKEKDSISPEVEHALGILDQAMSIVRGQSVCNNNCCKPLSSIIDDLTVSDLHSKAYIFTNGDVPESSNKLKFDKIGEHTDEHRQSNTSSSKLFLRKERFSYLNDSQMAESSISFQENFPPKAYVKKKQITTLDSISKVCVEESLKANEFFSSGGSFSGKTKKKNWISCLSPCFIRIEKTGK